MKCKNCTADVPPQWVHSINTNTCPSCGSELMSNDDLTVLAEVRDAMQQMPNNPEGLAGWLLSHYRLVRTGTAEPAEFHQKSQLPNAPYNPKLSVGPTPQAANAELMKQFFTRAGHMPPDVAALKRKAGAADMDIEYDDQPDEEVDINGNGEYPFPISIASATDPRETLIQKQTEARKNFNSGGGSFRR